MARLDATGADINSLSPAVMNRAYPLQVGIETALGYIMCMADVAARQGLLSADLANSRHDPIPKDMKALHS